MLLTCIKSFTEVKLTTCRPLVICDIDDTILHFKSNKPTHTDYEGFLQLSKRISELNGKLIFLTARNKEDHAYTRDNFTSIGLNYDDYEVHYTNNKISKGEYIYKYIQTHNHDSIIFIDDRIDYINSVLDYTPYVDCYMFYINN